MDDIAVRGAAMVQPEEVWKPIPGYEGLYEVSSYGNVRSLPRTKSNGKGIVAIAGKVLKPYLNRHGEKAKYGYYLVDLNKNGKAKTITVHRLVALVFLPNPENKPEIDHINTIRTDNRAENLRWCDRYENYHNPLSVEKHKGEKGWNHTSEAKARIRENQPNMRKIEQINLDGVVINIWDGIKLAARETGISQPNISNCCIGKRKTAGGYYWRYK